jgi:hypothetical protein
MVEPGRAYFGEAADEHHRAVDGQAAGLATDFRGRRFGAREIAASEDDRVTPVRHGHSAAVEKRRSKDREVGSGTPGAAWGCGAGTSRCHVSRGRKREPVTG